MQLDRVTIALRPRPARQAIDLGFALLHARAATVYKAWLALWLPLVALAAGLTLALPDYAALWWLLPWWLKPLVERAPLYVLSRQVFGEDVTWRQAVRAWPGQLGGGWVRMLTWWRPIMAGRGLYQPIWQLEQARGDTAAARRALIGRGGNGRAAFLFGVACAHFEVVLQVGLVAFVGMFTSEDQFKLFSYLANDDGGWAMMLLPLLCYAMGGAIVGPIYVACCFTLYLNRRATLEAWDIELVLRQIRAPGERQGQAAAPAALSLALLPAALALAALLQAPPAEAARHGAAAPAQAAAHQAGRQPGGEPAVPAESPAESPDAPSGARASRCASMPALFPSEHLAARDAQQRALHRELDDIYAGDDLRGYDCEQVWRLKKSGQPEQREAPDSGKNLSLLAGLLAGIVRAVLIAGAIAACGWLLYRYRDRLRQLLPRPAPPAPATEVAGLDIRAASLPDDVTAEVRALWRRGEQRGALALLYRATLSRLVQRHGVPLAQGATEGDCLHASAQACKRRQLDDAGHAVVATVTRLWLEGAYAGRWPDAGAIETACAAWDARWRARREGAA